MKTMLSWSSGKDSAWALKILKECAGIELCGLFTTINASFDRVAMHAVRRELVEAQARAAGLALFTIDIPHPCPDDIYADRMGAFVEKARQHGVEAMAFGDLYLADIRAYREAMLAHTGITPLFPLWGKDTRELARVMIAGGLRAFVTCVDSGRLDAAFAGRAFDLDFLAAPPQGVDPCGENGEFHTLAVAGPMFSTIIQVRPGEITARDGFVFADFEAALSGPDRS